MTKTNTKYMIEDTTKGYFILAMKEAGFSKNDILRSITYLENASNEPIEKALSEYEQLINTNLSFDINKCLENLHDLIFPEEIRTSTNLINIINLAEKYNLDEFEIRKPLINSINYNEKILDLNKFEENVIQTFNNKLLNTSLNSPILYLKKLQNGIEPCEPDIKIIKTLITTYNFPYDVINVLIEYVHTRCQKLNKNYIFKIADNWYKLNINTKEKAIKKLQRR